MNIIGHTRQRTLLRSIAAGPLPHHAFFLSGPEGIGKSVVGLEFAASLLGVPDGLLPSGQDFLLLEPVVSKQGTKAVIPVESVRAAGHFLSRFPTESPRRVLMIDSAESMNESAQNAILKVLEEPNGTSVLILVSARPGAVRETIRSRAFNVPFSLVPEAELRTGAELAFGADLLSSVEPFFFSLGRPGIVCGALSDPKRFATRRDLLRSLFRITSLSPAERIALSEELSSSAQETIRLLEWWVSGLRFMRRGERDPDKIASLFGFLEEVEAATRTIRETNANPRLVLDRLFLVSL